MCVRPLRRVIPPFSRKETENTDYIEDTDDIHYSDDIYYSDDTDDTDDTGHKVPP